MCDENLFLDTKGKSFPQLNDKDWMYDFAFCAYITQYLNESNSNLQGTIQLIYTMFATIEAFESKLRLGELQLLSNNMTHFPTLRKEKPTDNMNMDFSVLNMKASCSQTALFYLSEQPQ
jgi:hypothetical protein